ncbi:hypothetical protein [Flexibacterium corallicola]|uniref:hypothetical protein n=1 Tax=Flexibacterium corallicola TaxID=3037259 RepID=UPI00286F9D86|nr:hypothetical protein [Pseudovibrio sp. M1P-2-3]
MKFTDILGVAIVGGALLIGLPALADAKKGEFSAPLKKIYAVQNTGSPAPEQNKKCEDKYFSLVGQPIDVTYEIDPTSGKMKADAQFMESHTNLFPLGIKDRYDFMSDGVAPKLKDLDISRIIFNMDQNMENERVSVMGGLDEQFNCVLISEPST